MNIYKLVERIKNEVLISSVIGSRLEVGIRNECLCPFHEDSKAGSFQFNDSKGVWKCFSCNEGGDIINFIEKYDKVSFREAVLRIALDADLISKDDYFNLSFDKNYVKGKPLKVYKGNRIIKKQRADSEVTDKIYSMMSGLFPLTKEHMDYLTKERGLSLKHIKDCGYFSMPETDAQRKALLDLMQLHNLNLDNIPGFYQKENQTEVLNIPGVGIPIKNAHGLIQAIQVRRDKIEEGQARYVFFSTSKDGGTSSGAPIDVVYPDEIKNHKCYITEGHFKAKAVADNRNSVCISLQGVNNTQELARGINELFEEWSIDEFIIAFDVDMLKNIHVINAAEKLEKLLKENFEAIKVSYVTWDGYIEKGIDDVILAGHSGYVKKMSADEFNKRKKKYLDNVVKLYYSHFSEKKKFENKMKLLWGDETDHPYRNEMIDLWNKDVIQK